MKIIVMGYYGKNFGDLLMLDVLLERYRNNGDSVTILTYAAVDEELYQRYGNIIYSLQDKALRFSNIVSLISKADKIVWGGGTCFMDEGGTGGIKYMLLSKLLGKSVEYIGIGVGKSDKLKTKLILNIANIISNKIEVRDKHSAIYFNSKKTVIGSDLAFSVILPKSNPPKAKIEKDKILCISYRNLDGFVTTPSTVRQRFIERVKELLSEGDYCKVVIINADEIDAVDSQYIYSELRGSDYIVEYRADLNPEQIIKTLIEVDRVITGRLHVGVFAAMLGRPFLLLNYSPKNKYMLEQIGKLECLINYESLTNSKSFQFSQS